MINEFKLRPGWLKRDTQRAAERVAYWRSERMTDQAEAQAALDAVRELMGAAQSYLRDGRYFAAESKIKSAIKRTEDLDARLKALEGKDGR